MDWADQLNFNGHNNWRLPTALNIDSSGPCERTGCTDSEMGRLDYNADFSLFTNFSSNTIFWSNTESMVLEGYAWDFNFNTHDQVEVIQSALRYAWAVHDGDITAVPLPAAIWLFGSGLLGLAGVWIHENMGREGTSLLFHHMRLRHSPC